jgi:hypothetical protein
LPGGKVRKTGILDLHSSNIWSFILGPFGVERG